MKQILIGEQLPVEEMEKGRRYALITDSNVKTLIAPAILAQLKEAGLAVALISFPAGEEYKTRETKAAIEDQLLDLKFGRDCALIALGGGVVTDLVGFIAATFCRGVPFYAIPTTLLGMVDASIGGKTGVNTPHGKNLIGAFYPAHKTLIDLSLLATLPKREWRNGIAEMIKHATIDSPSLFQSLERAGEKWDFSFLKKMVSESIRIKNKIIEEDPYEKGLRAVLNFGHTIGHALEAAVDYGMAHGEAVALGMVIESEISHKLGILRRDDVERIRNVIGMHGFSLQWPEGVDEEKFIQALLRDKKVRNGKPRMVILETIGKVTSDICVEIPLEMITWTLNSTKS